MSKAIFRTILMGLFLVVSQVLSVAQESKKGHSHAKAEMHGGTVAMTKMYHFEVVFKEGGIAVYLYDGKQKNLSAEGVEGEVTLKSRGGDPKTIPLKVVSMHEKMGKGDHKKMEHGHDDEKMHDKKKEDHHKSMSMNFLQAKVDLSKAEAGNMKAVFSLKGLPNEKETSATFTETFNGFSGKGEKSHHGKKEESHHDKKETHEH